MQKFIRFQAKNVRCAKPSFKRKHLAQTSAEQSESESGVAARPLNRRI